MEVCNQSKLTTNGKEALLVKAVKNFPNNIEILPRAFSKKKTSFLPKSKPYECSVKSAGHAESRLGSGWGVKGGVRPPSQGCQHSTAKPGLKVREESSDFRAGMGNSVVNHRVEVLLSNGCNRNY